MDTVCINALNSRFCFNDNIFNIYARVLKSKALFESNKRRKMVVIYLQNTFEKFSGFTNTKFYWLKSSYSDIRKMLRIDKPSIAISSEISNYLSDIQKRIYKLPIVYQYLFENIPVKEFNLFLARENEIKIFNNAYNDWLIGNFAATMIIGENGSGKSSLLHYYSKTLKSNYQITNFQVSRFFITEQDFFSLINEIFNQKEIKSDKYVKEYISTLTERRIIIIDGLERIFLRTLNGFICLQKLLSLIVSTNKNMFWICSVSLYAADYLNKTIGLSDFFDYSINIDNLTSEQIKKIILKRNRISGYQIIYLDEKNTAEENKHDKLNQKQLEEYFFLGLNKFANSNISLSLNYWLQSIISVQGDNLIIGSFSTPDFSFLESISPEKTFALLLIVLHGKLSVEQHSLICNEHYDKSYKILTILKEDSILVEKGDYFILNGILYRHVIKLLKNKNLIY